MKHQLIPATFALMGFFSLLHAAALDVDKTKSRIQADAQATGHSFTSSLNDYKATVSGDASSLLPSGFNLGWNFSDLDTGDVKRNTEMIKWLGGGKPKGSFKFTKSWTDKAGKKSAMGDLTINGVSKTISFPFTAKKDGDWITIDGAGDQCLSGCH